MSKVDLYYQKKRRKHKIKLAKKAIVLILISLIFITIYLISNNKHIIKCKENAKAAYKVKLIENEFYDEDVLRNDVDVISGLIKDIDTEFKYNLELSEELEYKYAYNILAEVEVKEKSKSNVIYKSEQELLHKDEQENKSNSLEISEKINIDYNQYNNQIKKLVDSYRLQNTTSDLSINMYIDIINKATGEKINSQRKVMSIKIPLNTKTAEITIEEQVKNHNSQIIIYENIYENSEYCLLIGIIILIMGLIALGKLIKYILDTRSAEKIYDDELKKIIFDYKSYIQKTTDKIEYNDYKVINIDTFKELLSMREELQSPILMYTEEDQRKTMFMMINTNLLFMYTLESNEIRRKLIEKSEQKKKGRKNENNK